ncbi:hypothetical protein P3X46_032376 [Hevea brasiliensis]|uniref:Aspartic peptidase DDI1-type domain-containing protein n=1 Tax=Hevea brasiliensis TaxID=3981 RepID=A0ABQ9KD42_HEVBR|nr:hypothetical protein P3X46_032376 [Hevea brasiliensis]
MKLETTNQRDRKKYYHFHDDHKHTIDECWQLKDEIERLIRQGNLKRFPKMKGRQDKSKDKSQEKHNKKEPIGVIKVITRGLKNVFSVDTKLFSKDPITCRPRDFENIRRPHSDPLVINILVNRYMMQRVLVDIGSSVNLITLEVYEKLGLKREDLTKVIFPLVRLGDKIVSIAETTNLTVILDDKVHK